MVTKPNRHFCPTDGILTSIPDLDSGALIRYGFLTDERAEAITDSLKAQMASQQPTPEEFLVLWVKQ